MYLVGKLMVFYPQLYSSLKAEHLNSRLDLGALKKHRQFVQFILIPFRFKESA